MNNKHLLGIVRNLQILRTDGGNPLASAVAVTALQVKILCRPE